MQTVPPAVTPRPGKEAEQQQVPEHSPHGGTGSGWGERNPVRPGRHRHRRALHLHRDVPALSPSSLTPPHTRVPSLPAKIILAGKEPGCLLIPKTDPPCPGLVFFQTISWHKSQPGLILAGGRGEAARPQLSPEQDTPYLSTTGAGRGCPAPLSPLPSLSLSREGSAIAASRVCRDLSPPSLEPVPKEHPVSCPALPALVAGGD